MPLDDDSVIVAATGYVYVNTVAATSPTPADITAFDHTSFGGATKNITIAGAPTSFTLTVTVGSSPATTASLLLGATAPQVQAALEALPLVGVGNVSVSGTSVSTPGMTVSWIGDLLGTSPTVTGTFVAGTTPSLAYTTVTAPNGWIQVGHTSREKMPEFGFDGGKQTLKGTWQKKSLREVQTGDPVADSVKLTLEQFDRTSLELYYGADAAGTPGVFGVDGNFTPVEKSFLTVLVDGDDAIGFYAAKASIQRDAAIALPIDDFAGFPIIATFLDYRNLRLYDWISETLFA
jgi:hypothetical protein